MTLHRTTVTKRLFALLASTSLIMAMGACSSDNETQSHEAGSTGTTTTVDAGNVVIDGSLKGKLSRLQTALAN